MKKKILFIALAVAICMILCLVLSFFAFAAEPEPEYDFMLISEDGTVTYHNVGPSVTGSLADSANTNPTYVASQNGGPATLKMLRDIETNYHVTLLGNVNFDGQGHTFTYTGTDYAFWVANSNFDLNETGYGVNKPENEMKRAKFVNLKFVAKGDSSCGFKFYNSILEFGDGNVIERGNKTKNLVLTARNSGKLVISGGDYTASYSNNIFVIGGDHHGYTTNVSLEITGGTFFASTVTAQIFEFEAGAINPSLGKVNITGGVFHTAGASIGRVNRGTLTVNGGNFYGNITVTDQVTVSVTKGNFPKGCTVRGGNFTVDQATANGVYMEDPIVARVYVEGALAHELTRTNFVNNFNELTPTVGLRNTLKSKNYRVELIEDFETFRIQLGMNVNAGKTATISGNGKTITGHTQNNPILRAHGPGTFNMDDLNLYNKGASCFQFYDSVTVNVNKCIWEAPNHRTIFPTNKGTVNINSGSVMRGGGAALYFNILTKGYETVINVKSGAMLVGADSVISFQAGSHDGNIYIEEGAELRCTNPSGNVIALSADRHYEDGVLLETPVYSYDNTIHINGGILEGNILNNAERGRETNVINFNYGTIYTSQTKADVQAQSTAYLIKDAFVFSPPLQDPYYVVSIPSIVSITPTEGYSFNISASLWRFNENSQLAISVESQNDFTLRCDSNDETFGYTVMSSQMGSLSSGGMAACFTMTRTDSVALYAYIHEIKETVFAGEYSDTLTFTASYTEDVALVETPTKNVNSIAWKDGAITSEFIGSAYEKFEIVNIANYKYSDLFVVPTVGTTVTFKDYYDPNATVNYSVANTTAPTPYLLFVFSTWENQNGVWSIDRDWEYNNGWQKDDDGMLNSDRNQRGHRLPDPVHPFNEVPYCDIAEQGTEVIDGVTYGYIVFTYTTQRANEVLRVCYANGTEASMPESLRYPEITVTPPKVK